MSEKKPFFSVVVPLYNKQNYVEETIKSVLEQSFQDFEIVVVDDGSTDGSVKIVESILDDRIRIINQKNAGVSAARNKGVKEAKGDFIAFLDADDLWLPEFLSTIYDLTRKYKDAGLYATAYKMSDNGEFRKLNIKGLPQKDFEGIMPNYFKSVVLGDLLVWTSAICIPKKIFFENDIWFPKGEKYGEDQYVWVRIAMKFDICYNTKPCAIYQLETDNNCLKGIFNEKEPHKSILKLNDYKDSIKNVEKLRFFNKYLEKSIYLAIFRNILSNDKKYAFYQLKKYDISLENKIKLFLLILIPFSFYSVLKNFKNRFKL